MKIANPYSKGRFSRKEKFQRSLTKKVAILKPFLKERYKHDFLSSLYLGLKGPLIEENVSIPEDIQVDLLSITVADIIPVEELSELKSGLIKIFKLYPPKFNFNDTNRIDNFFENISNSIHGIRWSNLGSIQFEENTEIGKYINYVNVQATQVSSSIIVMQYQLLPSEIYLSMLKELIDGNSDEEIIFTPRIRSIFKYWGSSRNFSTHVKNRKLEDYILELKWRFLSKISRYVPSFFHKNEIVPPGILVYKIKQEYYPWKDENNHNLFWESIGLPQRHHLYHDISLDGAWQLHGDSLSTIDLDDSVRISCNSKVSFRFTDNDIDRQIIHTADYFVKEILPILAIRKYTLFISKQIAIFRISTFKSIKNTKIKYKKILRQRLIIEQNGHMLARIKNEIKENDYKTKLARIQGSFSKWEPTDTRFNKGPWVESVVAHTEFLVNETYRHSESLVKTIDTTVGILTIQTNFSLQRRTVILTIVTIILAVVTIYMTYYQISEESPIELVNQLLDRLY